MTKKHDAPICTKNFRLPSKKFNDSYFDMNSADSQMDFSNPSLRYKIEIQNRYYCIYKQQISHYTKSSLIYDAGRRKKKGPNAITLTTRTLILPRKIGRFKNDRA